MLNLLGESEANQRKILTADDVTQDERGLRQLIEAGCFRSAVNLTGRCLTIYGQGYGRAGQPAKHTPHSLQLWFTRFALLLKLGQYDLCQSEAEPFGQLNRPDVYFQVRNQNEKKKRRKLYRFINKYISVYYSFIPNCTLDVKVRWHHFPFVYY